MCRNQKFIEACNEVENGTEAEKLKVAREFGLVKFKSYSDVQTRANIFPTFKDGAIKTIPNIGDGKITRNVHIFPGQVLIRFKLKTDVNAIAAIEAQLDRAQKKLIKLSAQFQNDQFSTPAIFPEEGVDCQTLIRCLRQLDLKANGIVSKNEVASYLYDCKKGTIQYENIESTVKKMYRENIFNQAKMYPIEGYRYLALRLGSPF